MDKTLSNRSSIAPISIPRAIEVFVDGFCFTRSSTHPYRAERVGPLWVMRRAAGQRGAYRTEEWVAYDIAPPEIDRVVRQQNHGRFAVCVICGLDEPQAPLRSSFKALGYRLGRSEPLMVHKLRDTPQFESPARVERVMTAELAERLARATRSRPLAAQHLAPDSRLRQYVASIDEDLVGWVQSIGVGDATWCSSMYVKPAFRRRGVARAMLCRMLHDDQRGGAQSAVLLASHSGAKLYPVVGYEQIGELLFYMPKERI